ncbi:uncharacterized protein CMC5_019860 [Chondromyces crocatus]|uniref:Uncharacterized protein n=1 Tax=Chondromyces crocatus TaxID=52 RepID=A0A0K1EB86_CHOCO|nr:uncharacterized protein CMC5_019860 [Chondromyces crocatus]
MRRHRPADAPSSRRKRPHRRSTNPPARGRLPSRRSTKPSPRRQRPHRHPTTLPTRGQRPHRRSTAGPPRRHRPHRPVSNPPTREMRPPRHLAALSSPPPPPRLTSRQPLSPTFSHQTRKSFPTPRTNLRAPRRTRERGVSAPGPLLRLEPPRGRPPGWRPLSTTHPEERHAAPPQDGLQPGPPRACDALRRHRGGLAHGRDPRPGAGRPPPGGRGAAQGPGQRTLGTARGPGAGRGSDAPGAGEVPDAGSRARPAAHGVQ